MTTAASTPSKSLRAKAEMWIPGLHVLRTYQMGWLPRDLVAGLVLSALLVPQGMAYAELAGLPAITGLYTTVVCLLAYAAFGPSPYLVLGPDSSLGPDDRGGNPAPGGRRRGLRHRTGGDAGVDGRRALRRRRHRPAWLCRRSDLQAGARRLPGRSGHHHFRRPTAQSSSAFRSTPMACFRSFSPFFRISIRRTRGRWRLAC